MHRSPAVVCQRVCVSERYVCLRFVRRLTVQSESSKTTLMQRSSTRSKHAAGVARAIAGVDERRPPPTHCLLPTSHSSASLCGGSARKVKATCCGPFLRWKACARRCSPLCRSRAGCAERTAVAPSRAPFRPAAAAPPGTGGARPRSRRRRRSLGDGQGGDWTCEGAPRGGEVSATRMGRRVEAGAAANTSHAYAHKGRTHAVKRRRFSLMFRSGERRIGFKRRVLVFILAARYRACACQRRPLSSNTPKYLALAPRRR